jgi:hypothetical protein
MRGGVKYGVRAAMVSVVDVGLGIGGAVAGGEGAGRDGGGHESTQSALWCGESLPFSTWSF